MQALKPVFVLTARLIGAIAGGYAITAALMLLISRLAHLAGATRSDAVMLSVLLGFVLYGVVLIWAFSVRRLAPLWGLSALAVVAIALLTRA
ncbi:iron transporter [Xylophilus sp. ASV27]|uniref:iron transporter n=1 Tax=Xylophilus sp. ASV27 TaxID=2795129 RepID=UPI0018ECDCF6|nr:iron transporter [Xylophilus sp. ASV27]